MGQRWAKKGRIRSLFAGRFEDPQHEQRGSDYQRVKIKTGCRVGESRKRVATSPPTIERAIPKKIVFTDAHRVGPGMIPRARAPIERAADPTISMRNKGFAAT
jgi:hypothetical protein